MRHLSTLARVITPAAMVVFLAHEISQSMAVAGLWYWLLLIGSFATAIGIEIVGILAGHALEGYWRLADLWRSLLAFVLLLAYTVTAVIILYHNPAMMLVPVIAAIVYLLSSLTNGLETAVSKQVEEAAVNATFDREQTALDRDLERRMKAAEMKLKHEEKMARIEAKKAANERRDVRQDSGELPGDWRQLSRQQKHGLAGSTREERENMFPELADRTRREWHNRLDKIAAQNGNYVV